MQQVRAPRRGERQTLTGCPSDPELPLPGTSEEGPGGFPFGFHAVATQSPDAGCFSRLSGMGKEGGGCSSPVPLDSKARPGPSSRLPPRRQLVARPPILNCGGLGPCFPFAMIGGSRGGKVKPRQPAPHNEGKKHTLKEEARSLSGQRCAGPVPQCRSLAALQSVVAVLPCLHLGCKLRTSRLASLHRNPPKGPGLVQERCHRKWSAFWLRCQRQRFFEQILRTYG
nr:uncharacterized protein LOC103350842 [Oryctolagus cuniculus]